MTEFRLCGENDPPVVAQLKALPLAILLAAFDPLYILLAALICSDGFELYYKEGRQHRADGPASLQRMDSGEIMCPEYHYNGAFITTSIDKFMLFLEERGLSTERVE
jgi:hypothetical protein